MLRSIFAGLFAIVLTLGLGISSVSAKTVEVKLGTDAGMLAFEPSTVPLVLVIRLNSSIINLPLTMQFLMDMRN